MGSGFKILMETMYDHLKEHNDLNTAPVKLGKENHLCFKGSIVHAAS